MQENLISILLGRNPGPIPRGKTIDQLAAPAIPGDLPGGLLQRRPDILQAEQNLVAANASIGAARALYYSNLTLQAALASSAAWRRTRRSSRRGLAAGTGNVKLTALASARPLYTYRRAVRWPRG